jgi:beta-phosphoglucomutase-like phosphatase (HAD superfamily)
MGYRGAIFDVDGVLVDSPHERAWCETLQLLMETDWRDVRPQTTYAPERTTPAVYQEIVAGKPHPMISSTAAEELEAPPQECFVVEDATSGVQAARAGNLAALGVARLNDEEVLQRAGADLVVTTVDDSVELDALAEGHLAQRSR